MDEDSIDVVADIIGMVKTITKELLNYTINNTKKTFQGGSNLMLKIKSTVPGDRPLISVG